MPWDHLVEFYELALLVLPRACNPFVLSSSHFCSSDAFLSFYFVHTHTHIRTHAHTHSRIERASESVAKARAGASEWWLTIACSPPPPSSLSPPPPTHTLAPASSVCLCVCACACLPACPPARPPLYRSGVDQLTRRVGLFARSLQDWARFIASWGVWGNYAFVFARAHNILGRLDGDAMLAPELGTDDC